MKKPLKSKGSKKELILEAAKKEFAEKGFEGARMDSIAKRASVNKALLHYHFSNKENLYKEVLIQQTLIGTGLVNNIKGLSNTVNMTTPEKLYLAIHLLVNMYFETMDPDFIKIISREMSDERDYFKELIRDYLIPLHEAFEIFIIEGVESGDFVTTNPLFVVISINTFIMNYMNSRNLLKGSSWYERLFGEQHKEKLINFLMEHTFNALRPKGKELEIPEISQEIFDYLKELIDAIKQEK